MSNQENVTEQEGKRNNPIRYIIGNTPRLEFVDGSLVLGDMKINNEWIKGYELKSSVGSTTELTVSYIVYV